MSNQSSNRLWDAARVRCACFILGIPVLMLLAGCGPSEEQKRLTRAMYQIRAELHPDYRDAIEILEKYRHDEECRNEYVQYGMCETAACVLGGHYHRAEQVSFDTFAAVQKYQDKDAEFLAAVGNEGLKFFNGEPHERALLCFYSGLSHYLDDELNEARMFFTQALNASRTKDEDAAEFRDDFRLGYYWLGRVLLRRGEMDEARAAFQKAAMTIPHEAQEKEEQRLRRERERAYQNELKAERACFEQNSRGKTALEGICDLSQEVDRSDVPSVLPGAADRNPVERSTDALDEFLSMAYQQQANLFIVIEMGFGPTKYASGPSHTYDKLRRVPYNEAGVDVFVDGHKGGPGFKLLDTYHQAVTRGVQSRRGRQTTKMVLKEIAKRAPFLSLIGGYWDVAADIRYWPSLPGEYHVFGARVAPGLHTLHFKFFDINDKYLPRYDITRHFIHVPPEREVVLSVYSLENQDNRHVLTQAPK